MGFIFVKDVEEKYPKKLLDNRSIIEGNVIGCLWKNPNSYGDYEKDIKVSEDFLTEDGQFYYALGYEMYKLGYNSFDKTTVLGYIETNEIYKMGFIRRGGYESISHLMDVIHDDNLDAYVDELNKYNLILQLYNDGFNILNKITTTINGKKQELIPFDLFKKMKCEEVIDWYDYKLMDNALSKTATSVKIEDLMIDDDFISKCKSGECLGLSYASLGKSEVDDKTISACPLLSYNTMGIHRGNVEIFAAYSGEGKTNFMMRNKVLAVLEQNEKCCIISNEQVAHEYKIILLVTVLSSKFKYHKVTKQKIMTWNLDEEELMWVNKAKNYINTVYKDRLKFAKIFDYGIGLTKKVIKLLAKEGFGYFVYDTFKSDDLSGENGSIWGNLIEDSKELFQTASKENVAVMITMQLAIHTIGTRYLTANTLSTAKGVKEVVTTLVLMRRIFSDEATGEKYDIKPYRFKKDKDGNFTKNKEFIEIAKEDINQYRILFLDKTRNGDDRICLLYRFLGHINSWIEVGFCNVENTGMNKY